MPKPTNTMTLDQGRSHDGPGLEVLPVKRPASYGGPLINEVQSRKGRYLQLALLLFTAFILAFLLKSTTRLQNIIYLENILDTCPQGHPVRPTKNAELLGQLERVYQSSQFQAHAYESLGGVIRIPTVTEDDEKPPSEDPSYWAPFKTLHEYLEDRFSTVYSHLEVSKVNTYALIYRWQGSDTNLKPILLTAHQDVVPIANETASEWIHDPFSGFYDGEWIWGRGSCDDKPGLTGILTAVESLLKVGFKPLRSIILAFGIDEEHGGVFGATAIRDFLLEEYGEDSFSILVDEGGGYSQSFGTIFSTPAVAEKGKLDVKVEVATAGGHSSVPPAHTGIGILSRLITEIEDNPHPSALRRESVYYKKIQCLAEHGTDMPDSLRKLIVDSSSNDQSLAQLEIELEKLYRDFRASTGTTQAVDIIHGGVKSNALPELAHAIVNHRIADHSSVAELEARLTSIVLPIASRFNLSVDAFGKLTAPDSQARQALGHLTLSDAYGTGLNPAPVSPTTGSGPWELLSGTILETLGSSQRSSLYNATFAVAPGLSLGNTDTRHYWNLTKHIFRYGHVGASDHYNGAHTVNEAIRAEGFLEVIRFFTILILNADETDLLD